ncbi:hypothetical protein LEP1GSC150_0513 [Leptospira interrogans serovar Copenhageni str. LT2050]|uniref:Uncharacterized protein n=1 Tax=Leptospira interrogans serovar Copenhageni str. LT2050 TaxID=1001598 RepID=M3G6R0_LEPIT|nr:hypothetical protein LEP1GSC150_0513 [Leptospira interrogans serovar Copenhageni str. LT2050]
MKEEDKKTSEKENGIMVQGKKIKGILKYSKPRVVFLDLMNRIF